MEYNRLLLILENRGMKRDTGYLNRHQTGHTRTVESYEG